MKNDALEQIAHGEIFEFCERLQHFQEPLLDPDSRLHALDLGHRPASIQTTNGTKVPWYEAKRTAYPRRGCRWWRGSNWGHNESGQKGESNGQGNTRTAGKRHQTAGCQVHQAGRIAQSGRASVNQEGNRQKADESTESAAKSAKQESGK